MKVIHSGTALTLGELVSVLGTISREYPDADIRFLSNYEAEETCGVEAMCLALSLNAPNEANTVYMGSRAAISGLVEDYEIKYRSHTEQALLLHKQAEGSVKPASIGEWYQAFLYVAALNENFDAALALNSGNRTGVTQEWTTKTPKEVYDLCFPKIV